MSQYITFAGNHPFLVSAIFIVSVMLIYSFFSERLRGFTAITPAQATQLINREDAVFLDVREENEFKQGHVVNAIHMPLAYVNDRITQLDKHKDKPIIVACRSGHRSASACGMLKKAGYESVYNLSGGMMAWESASLPLVKK